MDWWTEVSRVLTEFLDQHGLLAAFLLLLVEEAGLPVPVTGDFLMLLLGIQARRGQIPLWQAIVVMELATVLGATVLYAVSAVAGRSLVYRYGRFIRLTPERLDRAQHWINKHGVMAVFLGRLVPGLRIVTAVACGVFAVPWWQFIPAMAFGALLYIVFYAYLGYFVGPPVLAFMEGLHLPLGLIGSLVLLVVIVWWIVRARQDLQRRAELVVRRGRDHAERLRAGAGAGVVATITATLFINVLLNLAGNIAFRAPGTLVEQTAARIALVLALDVNPLLIFIALPSYMAVGVLWGALYGAMSAARRLRSRDWLAGLEFSLLPLATSLLVVMPLIGLGFLGMATIGPVAVIGEALRHAAYGLVLGTVYPVFLARRPVRALPHAPDDLPAAGRGRRPVATAAEGER